MRQYTKERNEKISKSKTKNFDDFLITYQKKYNNTNYTFFKFEYINRNTKMKVECNKHNLFFQISPRDLLRGRNCPECAKEIKRKKLLSNTEEFIAKAKKVHGDKYDYSEVNYIDKKTLVIIKCNICGEKFKQRPDIHLNGSGCLKCNKKSKGEKRIEEILKKQNINFETQKFFIGLKDINYLTYDFYLPDYNLLIEYNGKQHYSSKSLFYNNEKNLFHKQLHHDWLKRKYAKKNGYKLIIISYKQFNKIQDILNFLTKNIN